MRQKATIAGLAVESHHSVSGDSSGAGVGGMAGAGMKTGAAGLRVTQEQREGHLG
jgi:hypothetical protein